MSFTQRLGRAVALFLGIPAVLGAEAFPRPYDTERAPHGPMPAAEAVKTFRLPPGFQATVFAAEPDLQQPIAMTTDPRGRLWVAENYTYAEAGVNYATNLSDRVVILEDATGAGRATSRKVFHDKAKILTSLEVGRGGVFLLCPPRLLWVPDRDQDDVPDGEPEVLLDGFDLTSGNRHTFANGLKWGPDGWLWGRVGISSQARIGVPGTPEPRRVLMNGGIWRYHPERKVVEAVAHGTTNPWGLDWNALGEPFFINTVIGHLWHAIPGAHFERMHGDDVNPHSYGLIPQHADHYHFDVGAGWTKSRAAMDGSAFAAGSDALGGGHAHAGLMIYQGEDWPAPYRDQLFTLNLHGRRLNAERLQREGSGYVGHHGTDLFSVGDPWFRGIDLLQGPDGGVFISDWSDTGECHDHDGVHRTSGRIYKVTYGATRHPVPEGWERRDFAGILPLLTSPNEWLARQARNVLVERAVAGRDRAAMASGLKQEFGRQRTVAARLRILWALNAVGGADVPWLLQRLAGPTLDADEHLRSWAVRLLAERPLSGTEAALRRDAFVQEARRVGSPLVQLYLASALQHLPPDDRLALGRELVAHGEVAGDHNLPLLLWQGIEPVVAAEAAAASALFAESRVPLLRQFIARRLAEELGTAPQPWAALLDLAVRAPETQADLVMGTVAGTRGWRRAAAPAGWARFAEAVARHPDPRVREQARDLAVLFGDGRAVDDLRAVAADGSASPEMRRRAVQGLLDSRADNLAPILRQMANDTTLAPTAVVGLLQLDDPGAPAIALGRYPWLPRDHRAVVLQALVSRASGARAVLEGLEKGVIQRADLTPFQARQIAGLGDADLRRRLADAWGSVGSPDADKRATIERFRAQLTPSVLVGADLRQGRRVFQQACAACHVLYGEGGRVGPDLTGSGRSNLDYLLENVVAPSAVVPADYRMSIATLKDGRVLNGIVGARTARTLTLQGPGEPVVLEVADVRSMERVEQSLMPEGLLEGLPEASVRDLVAYLMHPRQVPLP